MITNINQFLLLENIQQAKKYLKEKGIDPKDDTMFIIIKDLLKSTPNLIGHFVKLAHEEPSGSMGGIEEVIDWINANRDKVGQLPKNVLEYQTIEELEDDVKDLERKIKTNKFYKSLYGSMRKSVDQLDKVNRNKFDDLALAFTELPEETKKQFTPLKYFKMNHISIQQFMEVLHNFIENETVNNDKESILKKLENHKGKYKIKYNQDNVLVIQTNDKETVCDLGSQSWCIVYSPDNYYSYYNPESANTQFIVYNFNLPSSLSNSMFGITMEYDGKTKYGGCQNKTNQGVSLEQIKEYTGIPDGILVPDPKIAGAKLKMHNLLQFFVKPDTTYISFINEMLKEFPEEDDEIYINQVLESISSTRTPTGESNLRFNNTFKDKTLDETVIILKTKYVDKILSHYELSNLLPIALILSDKLVSQMIILYFFHLLNPDRLQRQMVKVDQYTDSIFPPGNDEVIKFLENIDITKDTIKTLLSKLNIIVDDESIIKYFDFMNKTKKESIRLILELDTNHDLFGTFDGYKKIYDKFQLPIDIKDDTGPYDAMFTYFEVVGRLSKRFSDEKEFFEFISEQLNLRKNDKKILLDTVGLILDDAGGNGDDYSCLDDSSTNQFLTDLIKGVNIDVTDLVKTDDIFGLYAYNELDNKYNKIFKERIDVHTDENGVDYVEVSDFTSFDDLIFKEEYFNMLEDFQHFDWYDVDDYTLESYFDDLDDYNIIDIAKHILIESPEFEKLLPSKLVNEYITDSENMVVNGKKVKVPLKGLEYQYGSTEKLKEIKKILDNIIFNYEDTDVVDFNYEDYDMDFIEEDIKKEMIYRALMYAQESVQYDYMWNALIDTIGEYLGGSNWPNNDEETPKVSGDSIYKFVDSKLLFTIDISNLVQPIDNYYDLNYNYGQKYDWGNLVSYVAKELNSPTDMEYKLENASYESPDKKSYNEAFRNL